MQSRREVAARQVLTWGAPGRGPKFASRGRPRSGRQPSGVRGPPRQVFPGNLGAGARALYARTGGGGSVPAHRLEEGAPPGPGAGTHRVLGAEALHPELRGRRRLPADAAPAADSLGPGGQAGCRGAAPPRGRPRAPPAAPSAPARGPGSWRARDPPRSSSLRREACLVRGKGRGRLPSSAVAAAGMPT